MAQSPALTASPGRHMAGTYGMAALREAARAKAVRQSSAQPDFGDADSATTAPTQLTGAQLKSACR